LREEASPGLAIAGQTWEGFLAGRSRNFREQVRRRERALVRDHDLSFRLAEDPDRLDADLSTLFALHDARWGEEGSGAFAGARGRFHRELAAAALAGGWLRLWLLEADGAPVAAWYGFRAGAREWYYQSGRDLGWDRRSVGFVLLNHTIRSAMADGMTEYRLLRGDETYKGRFATNDHPLQTRAVGRGPFGRSAVLAARAAVAGGSPRLRQAVKRAAG
jgi:CelD/BcsL family acetyltransferase involved in cellulose biosynthesis